MTIAPAAAAEIMTVCRIHGGESPTASVGGDFRLLGRLAFSTESVDPAATASIALTRDERGFDLIVNWRQENEHSLRAAGADILGMELGSLIHLMVPGDQGRIEHYLFNLDEDGSGDLLWNREASLREDDTSSSFVCTKPR
jgi:hypothetical protein